MADISGTPKQEIKLFYCYAHGDKALRDELQVNLAGLRRQYQLTNWYDREILPGERWEEAIDEHLSTADVILLLISPHFVDSDYCYGKEMQHALERHNAGNCCVIPILLRPTYWEDTPLGTIQMLPTDARPITRWPDRDDAFHDVARGISTAIKTLLITRIDKIKNDWLNKGHALFGLKQYEEALTAYEEAIRLDPNFWSANLGKGHTLAYLERFEETLAAYDQVTRLDPNNVVAYCTKGCVLYGLMRYEEALANLEQAIRLDPNNALTYGIKGFLLYGLEWYEEALANFEQAIRLDPNNAVAYYNKGSTLQELRRWEEAQQAFDTARQLGYNG